MHVCAPVDATAYLKAPNGATNHSFGGAVSVSGDTIVVAAPFESGSSTASVNGDSGYPSGTDGSYTGAVYVFIRRGLWSIQAYLKAPNLMEGDQMGIGGVSISGDTIVVGTSEEDCGHKTITNGATGWPTTCNKNIVGAAYVFVRTFPQGLDWPEWAPQAYLKAPDAARHDRFG